MSAKKQNKLKLNSIDWMTALVSSCFAAGLALVGWSWFFDHHDSTSLSSRRPGFDYAHKKAVDKINSHLQADEQTRMLRQLQRSLENHSYIPELRDSPSIPREYMRSEGRSYGLRVEPDKQSQQVYNDLFGRESEFSRQASPEQTIQALVEKRRFLDQYETEQKLQFVETFVERAKEQGYLVILNEDLEVVKVRKIRREPSYNGRESIKKIY